MGENENKVRLNILHVIRDKFMSCKYESLRIHRRKLGGCI